MDNKDFSVPFSGGQVEILIWTRPLYGGLSDEYPGR